MRGVAYFPTDSKTKPFIAIGVNRVKSDPQSTAAPVIEFSSEKSTKRTLVAGVDYAVSLALKLRGELEANRFDGTGNVGTYRNTSLSIGLYYNF